MKTLYFLVLVAAQDQNKELLFAALANVDSVKMSEMAKSFSERNETIADLFSAEVREAILGKTNQGMTMEVFTNQTMDYSERLEKLQELEDWADQADNGYLLFHYGGVDYLVQALTNQLDHFSDLEILSTCGRVFAAAVQNNEKTQQALLDARPGIFKELGDALNFSSRWVMTAVSALMRRTPEVMVNEDVLKDEVTLKEKLRVMVSDGAAPEWFKTRGTRLLSVLD